MIKRVMLILLVAITMLTMSTTALATNSNITDSGVQYVIRSSAYLDSYSVGVEACGNGKIAVAMTVDGKGIMDKIGVREVEIERKVNGIWEYVDSLDAVNHPEFYDYNSRDYVGTTYFWGTPGTVYRVTLTVYARNSSGSDSGYITSYTVVCV